MIVRHFNTDLSGGAAVAAKRLHGGLLDRDITSKFFYHQKYDSEDQTKPPSSFALSPGPAPKNFPFKWLHKKRTKFTSKLYDQHIAKRPEGRELFSLPWELGASPNLQNSWREGILHLHWIAFWLDQPAFFQKFRSPQPIVWTLHDMNPITGGCHHADDCQSFRQKCHNCVQLANRNANDAAHVSFKKKEASYRKANLHLVTPSRWMEKQVRASYLGKYAKSVQTIRNALDLSQFQPVDKMTAKRKIGVPEDQLLIGFGAASLSNQRKGIGDLLKALEQLGAVRTPANPLQVVFFGNDPGGLGDSIAGVKFHSVGYLRSPEQQRNVYSAMDLFVMPSWAENMPQTVIESLACQTPVVAYDIGGIPEVVVPEETGLLAKHRNPSDLAEKIHFALSNPDNLVSWGENGRQLVCNEFSVESSCEKYLHLYRSLVS